MGVNEWEDTDPARHFKPEQKLTSARAFFDLENGRHGVLAEVVQSGVVRLGDALNAVEGPRNAQ